MIHYSYTKGNETNYSWAQTEKEFEMARKRLEKEGWTVVVGATVKSYLNLKVTSLNTRMLTTLQGVAIVERLEDGSMRYLDPNKVQMFEPEKPRERNSKDSSPPPRPA